MAPRSRAVFARTASYSSCGTARVARSGASPSSLARSTAGSVANFPARRWMTPISSRRRSAVPMLGKSTICRPQSRRARRSRWARRSPRFRHASEAHRWGLPRRPLSSAPQPHSQIPDVRFFPPPGSAISPSPIPAMPSAAKIVPRAILAPPTRPRVFGFPPAPGSSRRSPSLSPPSCPGGPPPLPGHPVRRRGPSALGN